MLETLILIAIAVVFATGYAFGQINGEMQATDRYMKHHHEIGYGKDDL
ncbi:hypothetical protein [Peribacillus asahii]